MASYSLSSSGMKNLVSMIYMSLHFPICIFKQNKVLIHFLPALWSSLWLPVFFLMVFLFYDPYFCFSHWHHEKVVSMSACQSLAHFHQRGATHRQRNRIAKVHDWVRIGVRCLHMDSGGGCLNSAVGVSMWPLSPMWSLCPLGCCLHQQNQRESTSRNVITSNYIGWNTEIINIF